MVFFCRRKRNSVEEIYLVKNIHKKSKNHLIFAIRRCTMKLNCEDSSQKHETEVVVLELEYERKQVEGFHLEYRLYGGEEEYTAEVRCLWVAEGVRTDRIPLPFSGKTAREFFQRLVTFEVFPQHLREVYQDFLYRLGK